MKGKLFRKSLRGFNKKDVTAFIEMQSNEYEEEKSTLLKEMALIRDELSMLRCEYVKTCEEKDELLKKVSFLEEENNKLSSEIENDVSVRIIEEKDERIESLEDRINDADRLIQENRILADKVNTLSEKIIKREEDFYIQKQRLLASVLEQTQYKQQAEQRIHELCKKLNFEV